MRRHPRNFRRANALIEMAIVLPVLSFLSLGLAEFGQYFYINNAFEAAARDAARFWDSRQRRQG
jgi:Flp pilus assembly protein TadG